MKKVNYYSKLLIRNLLNRWVTARIPALFLSFFLSFFLLFSMESNVLDNYTYDDGSCKVLLNSNPLNCDEPYVLPSCKLAA